MLSAFMDSESNKQFYVAIVGDTDDVYMQWGLAAVQSVQDSRFSIEFLEMAEEEAQKALAKGEISAYAVIPEGFMEKVMVGIFDPITYVTSAGMESVVSIFKKELTGLITEMVIYSQRGVYGLQEVLTQENLQQDMYTHMTELGLGYTDFIIHRNELYSVNELGVSDGLGTPQYYICAIVVLLMLLMGIPFGVLYIKKDYAFCRLLRSRGYSPLKQVGCEYGVHLLCVFLQAGLILLTARLGTRILVLPENLWVKLIPVAVMVAAFDCAVFELSDSLASGTILHFFCVIGMGYLSGCIYPAYVFPKMLQSVGNALPTGIARSYLASGFTGINAGECVGMLLAYSVLFFGAAWYLRNRKTAKVWG